MNLPWYHFTDNRDVIVCALLSKLPCLSIRRSVVGKIHRRPSTSAAQLRFFSGIAAQSVRHSELSDGLGTLLGHNCTKFHMESFYLTPTRTCPNFINLTNSGILSLVVGELSVALCSTLRNTLSASLLPDRSFEAGRLKGSIQRLPISLDQSNILY